MLGRNQNGIQLNEATSSIPFSLITTKAPSNFNNSTRLIQFLSVPKRKEKVQQKIDFFVLANFPDSFWRRKGGKVETCWFANVCVLVHQYS